MTDVLAQLTSASSDMSTDESEILRLFGACCQNWSMLLDFKVPSMVLARLLEMAVGKLTDSPDLANTTLCDAVIALVLRADVVEPGCPVIGLASYTCALQVAQLCLMYTRTRSYMAAAMLRNRDSIKRGSRMYWNETVDCDLLLQKADWWSSISAK